jgi:hypothetical protein
LSFIVSSLLKSTSPPCPLSESSERGRNGHNLTFSLLLSESSERGRNGHNLTFSLLLSESLERGGVGYAETWITARRTPSL